MVTVEAAEVEAEQDLADPVAIALGVTLEVLEPGSLHVLAHEHTLARERSDDFRDADERMPTEDPGQRALVLGLDLVVELLLDPLADLLTDRLRIESRGDPLGQAQNQAQVLHVRTHGRSDARILDLHGDAPSVCERRAIDLADRRSGYRLLVELAEHLVQGIVQLLLDP